MHLLITKDNLLPMMLIQQANKIYSKTNKSSDFHRFRIKMAYCFVFCKWNLYVMFLTVVLFLFSDFWTGFRNKIKIWLVVRFLFWNFVSLFALVYSFPSVIIMIFFTVTSIRYLIIRSKRINHSFNSFVTKCRFQKGKKKFPI